MSVITVIQCEVCKKQHPIQSFPGRHDLPGEWITLFQGNSKGQEASHFCSIECLARWATGTTTEVEQKPVEAPSVETPQSPIRRFLLIDGETADQIEGVKFSDGSVVLNPMSDHCGSHCRGTWPSWEKFKDGHEGSGVQWIDQEVSDASDSN